MALKIEFDFQLAGDSKPNAFLDEYELRQMFDSARKSLGAGLERAFGDVVCGEHGKAPAFKISGIYDRDTEDMDIQYHVDTCCQFFLLRVMRLLNQRN